jgi:hypothetical protein
MRAIEGMIEEMGSAKRFSQKLSGTVLCHSLGRLFAPRFRRNAICTNFAAFCGTGSVKIVSDDCIRS